MSSCRWLHWCIPPIIERIININPSQNLPKNSRGGNTSQLCETRISSIPKPKASQENYKSLSLMNTDAKSLNRTLANWIQQQIKRITHDNQAEFIPGCKVMIHLDKNIIISINTEISFLPNSIFIENKASQQNRYRGSVP